MRQLLPSKLSEIEHLLAAACRRTTLCMTSSILYMYMMCKMYRFKPFGVSGSPVYMLQDNRIMGKESSYTYLTAFVVRQLDAGFLIMIDENFRRMLVCINGVYV